MKSKLKIIIPVIIAVLAVIGAIIFIRFNSDDTNKISKMLDTAQKYLVENNYEQAIAEFENIIELDPKNVDAYIGIACVYDEIGNREMAIEWLEKAYEETESEEIKEMLDELLEGGVISDDDTNSADVIPTVTTAVTTDFSTEPAVTTISDDETTISETTVTDEENDSFKVETADFPSLPDVEQKYYIVFNEGSRNDRVELSVFDIDGDLNDNYISWGGFGYNLSLHDHSVMTNCDQYYIENGEWTLFIEDYPRMSDTAHAVIESNLDVRKPDGSLVLAASGITLGKVEEDKKEEGTSFTLNVEIPDYYFSHVENQTGNDELFAFLREASYIYDAMYAGAGHISRLTKNLDNLGEVETDVYTYIRTGVSFEDYETFLKKYFTEYLVDMLAADDEICRNIDGEFCYTLDPGRGGDIMYQGSVLTISEETSDKIELSLESYYSNANYRSLDEPLYEETQRRSYTLYKVNGEWRFNTMFCIC
ncbi:MAG: hypothetical protein J6K17_13370 [Oscillospiraceae bacterium]|nr:hypothetical protein [Oscillospiraceae bacterium]